MTQNKRELTDICLEAQALRNYMYMLFHNYPAGVERSGGLVSGRVRRCGEEAVKLIQLKS